MVIWWQGMSRCNMPNHLHAIITTCETSTVGTGVPTIRRENKTLPGLVGRLKQPHQN